MDENGAAMRLLGGVEIGLRAGLGAVFVYSGWVKAWNPARFAGEIAAYHLTSQGVATGLALALIGLEWVCGVALWTRWGYRGAVGVLLGLMGVFLGALITAWARGLSLDCGCFGGAVGSVGANYGMWIGRDLLIAAGLGVIGWRAWRAARREGGGVDGMHAD